ncbi:MAG TPA: SDR family NAD(P)-dependent oxidoreductase [Acidobacteriaceae bacterium]
MNLTGNTILITGGGSGIGLALAQQFHQRGNQVIIAGRRKSALDAATAANPGMKSIVLNIEDALSIATAAEKLIADFPRLNAVLNNAGIMRPEDLTKGETADAEAIVTTNLLGPIRLTAALMPHLLKQSAATILNVSSGLAFVPLAMTPTYCATKAAIHSYTESLRYQLRGTAISVLEIIPPWVATELMGETPTDPRAMPLDKFIAETMQILATDAEEICVQNVLPLRNAAASGNEAGFFKAFNDSLSQLAAD